MPDAPDQSSEAAETGAPRYAIGELADAAGVSRRAVRFYVQRGLVAPPLGVGRGAHYDASHLAQLLEIRRRQEAGAPLQAIADSFESDGAPVAAPAPVSEAWTRLVLAPGVELHVRADALTAAQKAALIHVMHTVLPVAEPTTQGDPE